MVYSDMCVDKLYGIVMPIISLSIRRISWPEACELALGSLLQAEESRREYAESETADTINIGEDS